LDRLLESLSASLEPFGQQHVLAHWAELSQPQREFLAEQLGTLDLALVRRLFQGGTAAEDWGQLARRAMAPPAFRLEDRHPTIAPDQAHQRGIETLAAGEVGVVLVAGGQGTRLGFNRPKGMFAIGPVSGHSLFQILLEKIVARACAAEMRIPLYLMTSPATHEETIENLRANENFGLSHEDLTVFCQGSMPAVDAETGQLLMEDTHRLALSPDGHGGTLAALVQSGALADIRARGLRHLFYCQVDNPLVEMCGPEFLGYHVLAHSELSTQVVAKRTSRDKVGNVVAIDGRLRIIEYSDLNPLEDEIVERGAAEGAPIFWAGNTANHVFDVELLERAAQSSAALPFHVARKAVSYIDASGQRVEPRQPNAVKFERFIFDLLPEARQAIVVEVDEQRTFAPVKNGSGEARDTPQTVGGQMIALHTAWLRAAGCQVAEGVAVEISPMFAQNPEEVAVQVRPGMVVTRPRYFC
jgi:UDP-N-acetylglucosamine/UDP-N-acetylgalactosamine diphosphorylase